MRELPRREGVGGEALVHKTECADHFGILELRVEVGDLRGEQQSFVYDGAGGKRRDIEEAFFGEVAGGDLGLGAFADDVELALERVLVHALAAAEEDLFDVGL